MSQAGTISAGAGPSGGITQVTTDDSNVVTPTGGNINILTDDTNVDNDDGIQSEGSGSTVTIKLTNRNKGTATTTDATPTSLMTVDLGATPGVYIAEGNLVAFNTTDTSGSGYTFIGAVRTDGATATELGIENKDIFEEASMAAADFSVGVSGNNLVVTVTGIAAKTIDWSGIFTYRFVG